MTQNLYLFAGVQYPFGGRPLGIHNSFNWLRNGSLENENKILKLLQTDEVHWRWIRNDCVTQKLGRKNLASKLVNLGCTAIEETNGCRLILDWSLGWAELKWIENEIDKKLKRVETNWNGCLTSAQSAHGRSSERSVDNRPIKTQAGDCSWKSSKKNTNYEKSSKHTLVPAKTNLNWRKRIFVCSKKS